MVTDSLTKEKKKEKRKENILNPFLLNTGLQPLKIKNYQNDNIYP
jgi:hypothetical protein